MRIIPDSWGSEDLREYNTCHEPAGSAIGGRFCSREDRRSWLERMAGKAEHPAGQWANAQLERQRQRQAARQAARTDPWDKDLDPKVAERVTEFAKDLIQRSNKDGNEHLAWFDVEGPDYGVIAGEARHVEMGTSQERMEKATKLVTIHTHPTVSSDEKGCSAFSWGDISTFLGINGRGTNHPEMFVVGLGGEVHRLTLTKPFRNNGFLKAALRDVVRGVEMRSARQATRATNKHFQKLWGLDANANANTIKQEAERRGALEEVNTYFKSEWKKRHRLAWRTTVARELADYGITYRRGSLVRRPVGQPRVRRVLQVGAAA